MIPVTFFDKNAPPRLRSVRKSGDARRWPPGSFSSPRFVRLLWVAAVSRMNHIVTPSTSTGNARHPSTARHGSTEFETNSSGGSKRAVFCPMSSTRRNRERTSNPMIPCGGSSAPPVASRRPRRSSGRTNTGSLPNSIPPIENSGAVPIDAMCLRPRLSLTSPRRQMSVAPTSWAREVASADIDEPVSRMHTRSLLPNLQSMAGQMPSKSRTSVGSITNSRRT